MHKDALPAIFPDYVDVTIPADIAPLNFAMTDDSVTTIDVVVCGSDGGRLHVNGAYADFNLDEWRQLLHQNRGHDLTVTVCAKRGGRWTQYRDFAIHVSPHPMEAWGVTYRRIPPSYELYSHMGIYQRDLSTFSERPIFENTLSPGACVNCHSSHTAQPTGSGQPSFLFHVRGPHGATVISHDGTLELLQARNDSLGGSMVYPSWHPSGRYVAFSTNKTSQMFHTRNPKRIEVYDSSSDVFVYDVLSHQILRDTLLMRHLWAENTPAFSADGRWLYFTTARRQVYPTDYDRELYRLCRVAFDEKTGRLGHTVDTLSAATSAGQRGASISWPRPSPDGRYVMCTRTDFGYFSIWHPEADLCLLDLSTGLWSDLATANSPRADSFHNWSPDGHWFVFTSRRDDGLYTRLYFAAIVPATATTPARATKPFLLPQRNPKRYYSQLLYSYNTPDFVLQPIRLDAHQTARSIGQSQRTATTTKDMH